MEELAAKGRPTDFREDITQEMLSFFSQWPEYKKVKKMVASAGRLVEVDELAPNTPPTLNKFAIKIGVHRNTLRNWCEINEDFLCAYKLCQMIQEEFICDRGLLGEYNQAITKMMLVNHTELKDRVEHDISDDAKNALKLNYKLE